MGLHRTRGNLVAAILMHDALNATVGLMALPIEDVVAGRAAADRGDTWPLGMKRADASQ